MIDIRLVRADPDGVKKALARKHVDPAEIDRLIELDARLRELSARRDGVRARIRAISKEVAAAKRAGDEAAAERLAAESRAAGEEERSLDHAADALEAAVRELLLRIPNLPAPEVPDGDSADDNVEVWVRNFDPDAYGAHQRVPHWEIGAELGLLDLEAGAKISGSMFPLFRGWGARLVRALVQYGLELNADAFEEIRPPTLVRTETLMATGQLPKFADDAYHIERDDLWAIPTAEVPLTSIHRDEILQEAELPIRMMAHTSCFRREAGAAGRDTRGLLRVHEFDKVEILALSTPEQAPAMLQELVERATRAIAGLGLAHRLVEICAGDLGQSHHRSFDLEVYAPGTGSWLEVSSISWFSDYQARRANIRYRPASGGGTRLVHTLNGSGLAVPRVWAALVETYRRPDGRIAVPGSLVGYLGGATAFPP
ncbi:MAG: serine--tRNA ligase [Acidimicrobiia bacterium]